MSGFEKTAWKILGGLAIVVVLAAGVRYQDPVVRFAGHVPIVGAWVQARFPDAFGNVAMPEHEHEDLIDYWTCSMHPSVHLTGPGACPICSMDLVPVYAAGQTPVGGAITGQPEQMPSMPGMVGSGGQTAAGSSATPEEKATLTIDPTWQQALAVTTAPVERRRLSSTVRTVGIVTHDENRVVDVNLRVSGWITRLLVAETGQFVEPGETLFELYSPELVSTQREYLLAVENLERVSASPEPEIVARARSLVEAARRRLLLWDLEPGQIQRLAETGEVIDELPIVSPAGGYVLEKMAVEGMAVTPGMRLYRIVALDPVWVLADVYESELPFVATGQAATLRLPHDAQQIWRARVDYLYPTLDPSTRTVKARLVVDNPSLALRPDMYVDVTIEKENAAVLAVPREAVLDLGARKIVFVDLGGGRLQAREVLAGQDVGGWVAVHAGLEEGDVVVTSGQFLIDAESKIRGVVPLPLPEPSGRQDPPPRGNR